MIPIKNGREIAAMRRSCAVCREILDEVAASVAPGMTTGELDRIVGERIRAHGARSAFLGYRGFPGNCCISVTEEVVHGIGGRRRIQYGDIVKLDIGIVLDGWIGDSAATVPVGVVSPEIERLMRVTEEALDLAVAQVRPGARVGDISAAVQSHAVRHGYTVVKDLVGHGVGRELHEEPQIPNFGARNSGPKLKPGMTLAIEPMLNMGGEAVVVRGDKWTVATADGLPSAHYEHTVLVTREGKEILTCAAKTASM